VVFVAFLLPPLLHSFLPVLMTPFNIYIFIAVGHHGSVAVCYLPGLSIPCTIITGPEVVLGPCFNYCIKSSYVVSIAHYSISLGICTSILKNQKCQSLCNIGMNARLIKLMGIESPASRYLERTSERSLPCARTMIDYDQLSLYCQQLYGKK